MFRILLYPVGRHYVRMTDIPNNVIVAICHVLRSLTVCPTPPSVLAPQHCFRPAVIDLVPTSISDLNTGYGNTCLFGYCVRFKFAIVYVMQNVIYYIPPLASAYDLR